MSGKKTAWLGLSKEELDAVLATWTLLSRDLAKNGVQLVMIFLTDYPQYMKHFKLVNGNFTPDNPKLKYHGGRVMATIDALFGTVKNKKKTLLLLEENARSHKDRKIEPIAYDHLRASMIKLVEQATGLKDENTTNGWNKLLTLMFNHIVETNMSGCHCP